MLSRTRCFDYELFQTFCSRNRSVLANCWSSRGCLRPRSECTPLLFTAVLPLLIQAIVFRLNQHRGAADLRSVFLKFDRDRNGRCSIEELFSGLCTVGVALNDEELQVSPLTTQHQSCASGLAGIVA